MPGEQQTLRIVSYQITKLVVVEVFMPSENEAIS